MVDKWHTSALCRQACHKCSMLSALCQACGSLKSHGRSLGTQDSGCYSLLELTILSLAVYCNTHTIVLVFSEPLATLPLITQHRVTHHKPAWKGPFPCCCF